MSVYLNYVSVAETNVWEAGPNNSTAKTNIC